MHEILHVGRREDIIPKIKYPFKLFVQVEWPATYKLDDGVYVRVDDIEERKVLNHDFTGGPCRLYEKKVKGERSKRIWVKSDGDWIPD